MRDIYDDPGGLPMGSAFLLAMSDVAISADSSVYFDIPVASVYDTFTAYASLNDDVIPWALHQATIPEPSAWILTGMVSMMVVGLASFKRGRLGRA